jgi:ribonucleoside-diphosphate reductase alpha chain
MTPPLVLDPTREWPAHTKRFHLGDLTLYGTVWEDAGRPVGLALMANGMGSQERGTLATVGRLVTLALQNGVPCEAIVRELKGTAFEPSGITGDKQAPMVSSVLDWVARWMEGRCARVEGDDAKD